MKQKDRIVNLIEKVIENTLVIFLLFMVILVFLNASLRYTMRIGILNSEELARFIFVWMCLLGCVVTHMKKAHLRVTFVTEKLPKKAEKAVNILARLITAGALVYLTYGAFLYVRTSSAFMNPGIPLNFGIVMSVILISAAGMLLADIADFVKFIILCVKSDKTPVESTGEEL